MNGEQQVRFGDEQRKEIRSYAVECVCRHSLCHGNSDARLVRCGKSRLSRLVMLSVERDVKVEKQVRRVFSRLN